MNTSLLLGDLGRPREYNALDEEEILMHFQRDPTISTRTVARLLGISQWKAWHTVHENNQHPYHYTPVQVIEEGDFIRRVQFCRYLLDMDGEDHNYLKKILWTDESKFDQDGITNYHNAHYWQEREEGNPHLKRPKGSQRRFSCNVWMGLINKYLIGPHFLPNNLTGATYEEFLRNTLFDLLEDVPLAIRRDMIYQQDGCPAHFRLSVRNWLDQNFPNRWIGRSGPIPWPARSPDLTPMDFYVWGHMKSLVYHDNAPVPTVEELRLRIINAAEEIKNNIRNTGIVKTAVRKRARLCFANEGDHFENQLK